MRRLPILALLERRSPSEDPTQSGADAGGGQLGEARGLVLERLGLGVGEAVLDRVCGRAGREEGQEE